VPSVAAIPDLVTVERYRQIPDDGAHVYELHKGEIVEVSRPKRWHAKLQPRLRVLLERHLGSLGEVDTEFAYRALPEFELRAADVAFVSRERCDAIADDDNLHGAPDLVVEVKSPSNRWSELRDLAALCLANGAREFWVVDGRSVTVIRGDGSGSAYEPGQSIPLQAFGQGELPVEEIFN
jgi:Uma2 family endonuclease